MIPKNRFPVKTGGLESLISHCAWLTHLRFNTQKGGGGGEGLEYHKHPHPSAGFLVHFLTKKILKLGRRGSGGPTEVHIVYPKKFQLQNLSAQKNP